MEIRPYAPADAAACLAVYDSHAPEPAERAAFAAFLTAPAGAYLVMEHEGRILGCGGFTVAPPEARLTWGMVHRDAARQGLGRFLLLYRLKEIGKSAGVVFAGVSAPRALAGFYARQGFKELSSAPGRVEMQMKLQVCS